MKRKILFMALLAMSSSAFANQIESKDAKEAELLAAPPVTYCKTANATDSEGNVVFSATCCKTFQSQPSQQTVELTNIGLTLCAEEALKRVLSAD